MTLNRAAVLRGMLRRPGEAIWSYELSRRTHVENGLVGRILGQLETDGFATSWWAGRSATSDGPRRHWYRLTGEALGLRAEVLAFLAGDIDPGHYQDVLVIARAHDDACPRRNLVGECLCVGHDACPGCGHDGTQCSCCGLTHV